MRLLLFAVLCLADASYLGQWYSTASSPSEIPLWGGVSLQISQSSSKTLCINATFGLGTVDAVNELHQISSAEPLSALPSTRVFTPNCFLGVEVDVIVPVNSSLASIAPEFVSWTEEKVLLVSQGTYHAQVSYGIALLSETQLQVVQVWSSQPNRTITWFFSRNQTKEESVKSKSKPKSTRSVDSKQEHQEPGADFFFYTKLSSDWAVAGDIGTQTFWLSLSGLANRDGAKLMLVYPEDWPFSYTPALFDYYQSVHKMSFSELASISEALSQFSSSFKGFVVWDKTLINTMSVAFTYAGLNDAIVVTEDLIPVLEKLQIPLLKDFRGFFQKKNLTSDAEVIEWSYDSYFAQCNHSYLILLGGECCKTLRPAVADFGVMSRAFFAGDLSTNPKNPEFDLIHKIASGIENYGIMVGWHAYNKDDAEHFMTTLMSSLSIRVHGLNTLPSLSFINKVRDLSKH